MELKNILITGGSGLVGRRLTALLQEKGYVVSWLSRSAKSKDSIKRYQWDIAQQTIDHSAIEWAHAIIHLAGEGVASGRWTENQKRKILDSRVKSTLLLHKALDETNHKVRSFISASAIGYYGMDNGDELLSENEAPGNDFLAEVTERWEEEVDKIDSMSISLAKMRVGVVLSEKGGALEKISQPIRWGLGAALGSGNQQMSWIHIDDLCGIACYLLEKNTVGTYNAVAPNPVTNKAMTKAIAKQLNKPLFLPNVPAFFLKIILGEMANMLLGSSKVSSKKIEKEGYKFKFPMLELALENLLR